MKKTSIGIIAISTSTILKNNPKNHIVLKEVDKLDKNNNATAKSITINLIDQGEMWWQVKVSFNWRQLDNIKNKVSDLEVILRWERIKNRTYYKIESVQVRPSKD